jgi:hypothetical protein
MSVVLLPGTAFVELALHAGRQVGYGLLRELTLQAPLVLGEGEEVQLQLTVGEPDGAGCRPLEVYTSVAGGADRVLRRSVDANASGCSLPRRRRPWRLAGARPAGAPESSGALGARW